MSSFKTWLSSHPPLGPVWISDGTSITREQVMAALGFNPVAELAGKRVALGRLSSLEFAATIAALDGVAEALLVLPGDESAEVRAHWYAQARIDTALEGEGLGLARYLAGAQPLGPTWAPGAPVETAWLLTTSGTTGTPKLVRHTLSSLSRSLATRPPRERFRWGSLYSSRRFAGLQVYLQSFAGCTPLILQDDDIDFSARVQQLVRDGCSALSATPSMWRKLAMHAQFGKLRLSQITLGGEIVDQQVLNLLATRFPEARITHIYASTEAGVGFAVRDGRAGFPSSYLQESPNGMEMKIDQSGHLYFRAEDWIDSGDVVRLEGERVYFVGRANGSINVGGNKVMPEEVEAVISELPEVAFAKVRPRKSPIMGNLVEAAILPAPGVKLDHALKKKIIGYCRQRLEAFKVPSFIVEAPEIPVSSAGKLSRA